MKIVFEPSECGPGCYDPGCHYMHGDSWFVGDVSFQTEKEAQEYLAELQATESQLVSGLNTLSPNRS